MAKPKKKLKKGYRFMRGLYRFVVAISSVIVVLFIALTLAVRPPSQAHAANSPDTPVEVGGKGLVSHFRGNLETTGQSTKERKELNYTFLLAATDDGNGKTDTLMVVNYDIPSGKVGIVSIPRDTMMEETRIGNSPKINVAYARGMDSLKSEVSNMLGIPLDFYILVDMEAFVRIVDQVGGVDFDVPIEMYHHDPVQNLTIRYMPGMQHLTGQQALEVARFRNNGDGTGYPIPDVGRAKTQQQMIRTIGSKILQWDVIANPAKLTNFVKIVKSYVETDMSFSDMLFFAQKAVMLNIDNGLETGTLPGDGTYRYSDGSLCYILYPEKALNLLNDLVNPYTTPLTEEDVNFFEDPGFFKTSS